MTAELPREVVVNRLLISRFPELGDAYLEETQNGLGEDAGSIIFYDLVFTPFIDEAARTDAAALLLRIAEFAEELLEHSDDYVRSVARTSIAEHVRLTPFAREALEPFLGPELARLTGSGRRD